MQVRSFCRILFPVLVALSSAAQAQVQSPTELRNRVSAFLQDYYSDSRAERVDIQVSPLDSRLQLAECDRELEMQVNANSAASGGPVTVHVRCLGEQPWALYVPTQVALYRRVAVASGNYPRGTLLGEDHVDYELRNTSLLRQGFLEDDSLLRGKELRRPVSRGEAYRSGLLDEPLAVRRGDQVALEAVNGSIRVRANGTALGSGRVGEQVRVRNDSSQRIVTGEITARGTVQTGF